MQVIKQANGAKAIKMSKEEWLKIGQSQGWARNDEKPNRQIHHHVLEMLPIAKELVEYDMSNEYSAMALDESIDRLEGALIDFINRHSL
tara:strand:+ start:625 stop:891 length:267 start_codon:yes stop_codon:yes gene_type:complete